MGVGLGGGDGLGGGNGGGDGQLQPHGVSSMNGPVENPFATRTPLRDPHPTAYRVESYRSPAMHKYFASRFAYRAPCTWMQSRTEATEALPLAARAYDVYTIIKSIWHSYL
jgi:hypothetical protein